MKLSQFCRSELIKFDLESTTKEGAIRELVELAAQSELVLDKEKLFRDVMEREKLLSTGIGFGTAYPHARTEAVKGLVIAFGRSEAGIDFDALDGAPVHLIFLVAVPKHEQSTHLTVIAQLSLILKEPVKREKLMSAAFPQEVIDLLDTL
ncbi:PTS sugar transporter subunit IIA [bacterium]|nr:PTS sugar transporter subunit IIA [bacterium]